MSRFLTLEVGIYRKAGRRGWNDLCGGEFEFEISVGTYLV
jgi:hypothetical protein